MRCELLTVIIVKIIKNELTESYKRDNMRISYIWEMIYNDQKRNISAKNKTVY